jgi:hypothetical protein
MATGGTDGRIIIWTPESNYPKKIMQEPLIEYRTKDEIAVEKVKSIAFY